MDGAPASTLATGLGVSVGIDVDESDVYVASAEGAQIVRLPLDGGPPVTVAEATWPIDVGVDAQGVYWTDLDWNDLDAGEVRMQLKSGGASILLAGQQSKPGRLIADATHVYWVEADGNRVMRVAK